jgi:hypothetical protein
MLPLGNFAPVGVMGDISAMVRQAKAPACYDRTKEGLVLGWAGGYNDGEPKVRDRKFPMMYLSDSADLSFKQGLMAPPSLGWVAAKDLRPFDIGDPACQNTKGFKNAQSFLRRVSARSKSSNMPTAGPSAAGESDGASG